MALEYGLAGLAVGGLGGAVIGHLTVGKPLEGGVAGAALSGLAGATLGYFTVAEFKTDFSEVADLDHWEIFEDGVWEIEAGELHSERRDEPTWALIRPSFGDLEISVRTRGVAEAPLTGIIFRGYLWRIDVGRLDLLKDAEVLYTEPFTPEADRWYTLRARMKGNEISCYLDERLVATVRDPSPNPSGRVGLRTAFRHVHFDDFQVRGLPWP